MKGETSKSSIRISLIKLHQTPSVWITGQSKMIRKDLLRTKKRAEKKYSSLRTVVAVAFMYIIQWCISKIQSWNDNFEINHIPSMILRAHCFRECCPVCLLDLPTILIHRLGQKCLVMSCQTSKPLTTSVNMPHTGMYYLRNTERKITLMSDVTFTKLKSGFILK